MSHHTNNITIDYSQYCNVLAFIYCMNNCWLPPNTVNISFNAEIVVILSGGHYVLNGGD